MPFANLAMFILVSSWENCAYQKKPVCFKVATSELLAVYLATKTKRIRRLGTSEASPGSRKQRPELVLMQAGAFVTKMPFPLGWR